MYKLQLCATKEQRVNANRMVTALMSFFLGYYFVVVVAVVVMMFLVNSENYVKDEDTD